MPVWGMGAMATFTVTSTADSGAGSLRQAILDANAADGRDAIVFDASFDGGAEDIIRLTSGQIEITDALRIDGGPGVTITGDAAGDDVTDAAGITDVAASGAGRLDDNSRIFDATDRLTLDGLTLTGGRTTADAEGGGAVRSTGARLTLTDSTVSGNSTAGNYAHGGGIYGRHDVTVTNSTVSGNSTAGDYADGGGICGRRRHGDEQHRQRQQHRWGLRRRRRDLWSATSQ